MIHWRITGRPDGLADEYQVVISNGRLQFGRELDRDPRLVVELDAVDFLRLVTGGRGGPELFMAGRLRVRGELVFAAQLAALFEIPRPVASA